MTKREKFIQMISYGPSKLPINFVLESFDMVEAEYAAITEAIPTSISTNVYTPVPDVPTTETPGVNPASLMGDTRRGIELKPAMEEEGHQENADALANLRAVTEADRKGQKKNVVK